MKLILLVPDEIVRLATVDKITMQVLGTYHNILRESAETVILAAESVFPEYKCINGTYGLIPTIFKILNNTRLELMESETIRISNITDDMDYDN